jgi:hypothetical protein
VQEAAHKRDGKEEEEEELRARRVRRRPREETMAMALRGIAFVSLSFPAAIAHTLALPHLLRKSPASFAISSLTVVHKTASLLSFTQTVVFSLNLQIVRNSNFKTTRVSKFRSFTQPSPLYLHFSKWIEVSQCTRSKRMQHSVLTVTVPQI